MASVTVDKPFVWKAFAIPKYLVIRSIDRKVVVPVGGHPPAKSVTAEDSKHAVLIAPGEHQIHVDACVAKFKLLVNAGHYCAGAVLRLDAHAGVDYRIFGDIDRKKARVDFWIEEEISGTKVTKPIRVQGFDHWK